MLALRFDFAQDRNDRVRVRDIGLRRVAGCHPAALLPVDLAPAASG
jgi:hypothetical protein